MLEEVFTSYLNIIMFFFASTFGSWIMWAVSNHHCSFEINHNAQQFHAGNRIIRFNHCLLDWIP